MLTKFKQKIKDRLGVPSQVWSLNNLKANGFNPSVIYDIGAYSGHWTEEMLELFPGGGYFLFEGQQSKQPLLASLAGKHPGKVNYSVGVLGAEDEKMVTFHEYETASSVLSEHFETGAASSQAKLKKLDTAVIENDWPLPDLLKLDTQGYELEILRGGNKCMSHAEVILMEVSFIDIYQHAPLAHEVIHFMHVNGFILYDICTLMRRPLDQALFQADMLFVKKHSSLVQHKKWQ